MTKKENFAELRSLALASNRTDLVAFIDHEVELLVKKNSAPKKPTAKQYENEALKDKILDILDGVERMTATEVANALEVSVSKASALLTQLREDNAITRTVDHRKAYFSNH